MPCSAWVCPAGCRPASADPLWVPHRPQLSRHCSTRLRTAGPTHRGCSHGLRLRPGAAPRGCPWALPPPGLSHCYTVGSSVAAREICSVWCPWAAGGWPAPLWASLGCMELLLCARSTSCTDRSACRAAISHCSLPAAVVQHISSYLNLLSQSTPSIAHGSAWPVIEATPAASPPAQHFHVNPVQMSPKNTLGKTGIRGCGLHLTLCCCVTCGIA